MWVPFVAEVIGSAESVQMTRALPSNVVAKSYSLETAEWSWLVTPWVADGMISEPSLEGVGYSVGGVLWWNLVVEAFGEDLVEAVPEGAA